MPYTLVERNGTLYAKYTQADFSEPRYIHNWYSLGWRYYDFKQYFASEEQAQQTLNTPLSPLSGIGNCRFLGSNGWEWRLVNGGQTLPDFTELEPIPEPLQRGKKCPVLWKDGQWWKDTSKGRVRA